MYIAFKGLGFPMKPQMKPGMNRVAATTHETADETKYGTAYMKLGR